MVKWLSLILSTALFSFDCATVYNDKVSIDIINQDGSSKNIEFEWPFAGVPPTGGTKALSNKVDIMLKQNGIDCPPKREKVSDNIWMCGDGKKIKSNDVQLTKLLSKVWDNKQSR